MIKPVDNNAICEFLMSQVAGDVTDFGYLLIPSDERLNAEALSLIKDKFKTFLEENDYQT
jgi:hypothetical protein